MANLTITVDEGVSRRARSRAALEGRSINMLLSEVLTAYAGADRAQRAAVDDLLHLSNSAHSDQGGRTWTRDELHERLP